MITACMQYKNSTTSFIQLREHVDHCVCTYLKSSVDVGSIHDSLIYTLYFS